VYTLLWFLALPFLSLLTAVRGLREPEYRRGWGARFGHGSVAAPGGIWVHAVSVGEVQAASILIEALRQRWPALSLSLSCATPTGRARARVLMPDIPSQFAPYDMPGSVRRWLARLRPRLLIVIEAELWPNLLHAAWTAGVPTLIASARVSARSARLYARLPGLLRPALAANVWVGAQSTADAARYATLGVAATHVRVTGNIKFDRTVPVGLAQRGAQLRAGLGAGRAVWVAGSTHAQEDAIVLQAHRRLRERLPDALLILAPRHPQRFQAAAAAIEAQGMRCARRTAEAAAAVAMQNFDVLLLDTLGELMDFYAAADVAFVGGSLVPVGGHNLLEPAALGIPVLSGPHQFNSPDIARALAQQGALRLVHDADELGLALIEWLTDAQARDRAGAAGRAVIDANRGARGRLEQMVEELLGPLTTAAPAASESVPR
jgi:3-deoxy-D-manno-octulosonic-acid transferase